MVIGKSQQTFLLRKYLNELFNALWNFNDNMLSGLLNMAE